VLQLRHAPMSTPSTPSCSNDAPDLFQTISILPYAIPTQTSTDLEALRYQYCGQEDYAILAPSDSTTWVVYFHSYGGNALEIFNSPLIHPLWLDAVKRAGFGLASFDTFGDSWMAPYAADAIHNALSVIKQRYPIKKLIFIGGSMGGSSVLIYSTRYPQDVTAALAMCPVSDIGTHYEQSRNHPDPDYYMKSWPIERHYGASEALRKEAFQLNSVIQNAHKLTMPLVISHGTGDTWIPVSHSDHLATLLTGRKDFKYFRYPDADHFFPSVQGFKDSWPWILGSLDHINH